MKPSLDFEYIANLINRSRVTQIIPTPMKQEYGKWALFQGKNKVPHFEYEFKILYLYADATKDSIISASNSIAEPHNTQVVYAPYLAKKFKPEEIRNFLRKDVAGVRDSKNYLKTFVQDQLSAYTSKITNELVAENYIEPPYKTPSGIVKKVPNPLMNFLSEDSDGSLGILIAEPGHGKTYTARYLASKYCKDGKFIPIYIHSPQWYTLSADDLSSLYKTITHSFKYFEAPIDWLDGCEEEFLRVTLSADLFRIIFDGFDEYVLWNHGKVDANKTLENLLMLAKSSGTNILVTSRTSFWQSDIFENLSEQLNNDLAIYEMQPFDINNAKNYFKKRFSDDENRVKRSAQIYENLQKTGTDLVGRGFILSLIADLVIRTESNPSFTTGRASVLQWIMKAFCEREVERQKLPVDVDQQLRILREFAEVSVSPDKNNQLPQPTSQLLREIISLSVEGLKDDQIDKLVSNESRGSLHDHPLLKKSVRDMWEFRYEQIRYNLLAELVIDYAKESGSHLRGFFSRMRLDGSLLTDIATAIVDQIYSSSSSISPKEQIKLLIQALIESSIDGMAQKTPRNLATLVATLTMNKVCPIGQERAERTKEFTALFPGSFLGGLYFSGTIASMDFCGVSFKDCWFDQLTWASCAFDDKTVFDSCHVLGGKAVNCTGFGKAQWIKESFDAGAKSWITSEQIRAGKKKYTKEDIKNDMKQLIKRFIPKEGVGFKTVVEKNLTTGTFYSSEHRETIIETFHKFILEQHHLSGTSEAAFNIKKEAKSAMQYYASNGVFTGALAETYEELVKKLKL